MFADNVPKQSKILIRRRNDHITFDKGGRCHGDNLICAGRESRVNCRGSEIFLIFIA